MPTICAVCRYIEYSEVLSDRLTYHKCRANPAVPKFNFVTGELEELGDYKYRYYHYCNHGNCKKFKHI